MSDASSNREEPMPSEARYPNSFVFAGLIWTVLGCVHLSEGAVKLPDAFRAVDGDRSPRSLPWPDAISGVALIAGGVAFMRGTAVVSGLFWTFGVASLVLGLFGIAASVQAIASAFRWPDGQRQAILLLRGIFLTCLFMAGVLILIGRRQYKAWRQVQKS